MTARRAGVGPFTVHPLQMSAVHRFPPWSWEFPQRVDLLWSKGVALHCDQRWNAQYWCYPTETRCGDDFFKVNWNDCHGLVYLRLGSAKDPQEQRQLDLASFARQLSRLRHRIVVVSSDGDNAVPGELPKETVDAILEHPLVIAWYTQNWDGTVHPKLYPIPIGLDLHSRRSVWNLCGWWGSLLMKAMARLSAPLEKRSGEILLDAHFQVSAFDRGQRARLRQLMQECPDCRILDARLTRPQVWREYSRHRFVLSPAGQGLDCHRTWEALWLGAIPIVRRSSLDPLFTGLSVALVDDWEEVLDPQCRAAWLRELAPSAGLTREALSVHRWIESMRTHLESKS